MAYSVTQDEIAEARRMDALTYLQMYEPQELVRISNNLYTTKTHDSMKIRSDGRWYWWSRRIGGHSALDYIIAVKDLTLPEAVHELTGKGINHPPKDIIITRKPSPIKPKEFILPRPYINHKRVFAYLMSRGIDPEIINHCIKHGMLYEEEQRHNAVFVGFAPGGSAKYATMRSTLSDSTFLRDVDGSDKRFGFIMKSTAPSKVIHAFEGAIDALSFATLLKIHGRQWRNYTLMSLGGVYKKEHGNSQGIIPMALSQYLNDNPVTDRIILCLDNDDTGKGAAHLIKELLTDRDVMFSPPPNGKDYNEYLQIVKGINNMVHMRGNKTLDYAFR